MRGEKKRGRAKIRLDEKHVMSCYVMPVHCIHDKNDKYASHCTLNKYILSNIVAIKTQHSLHPYSTVPPVPLLKPPLWGIIEKNAFSPDPTLDPKIVPIPMHSKDGEEGSGGEGSGGDEVWAELIRLAH